MVFRFRAWQRLADLHILGSLMVNCQLLLLRWILCEKACIPRILRSLGASWFRRASFWRFSARAPSLFRRNSASNLCRSYAQDSLYVYFAKLRAGEAPRVLYGTRFPYKGLAHESLVLFEILCRVSVYGLARHPANIPNRSVSYFSRSGWSQCQQVGAALEFQILLLLKKMSCRCRLFGPCARARARARTESICAKSP